MSEKTCRTCTYFVEENELGNYSHEVAVKNKEGFCLMKDLFTMADINEKKKRAKTTHRKKKNEL